MNEDKIPFHRPYPLPMTDKEDMARKIKGLWYNGMLTNDKYVIQLEEEIQRLYNVKYCIATNNGTAGLDLCYKYHNWIHPIHIPTFTWKSVDRITRNRGLRLLHDIDRKTWLMNVDLLPYGLVSPNHTFGNVSRVAMKGDHCVVYDGAHALGCELRDNIGDATVFSLAATKIITSCEGGLIITNQKPLADWVRKERDILYRLSEPHAIIGLCTLQYLDRIMKWKKKVFNYYLDNIPGQFQEIPIESNYNTIAFLNTEKLEILNHIEIKRYYDLITDFRTPNARFVRENIICLPSWYPVDYKRITDNILEVNKL